MTELTDDWLNSLERKEALKKFLSKLFFGKEQSYVSLYNDKDGFILDSGQLFRDSQEFANARNAYRKRINS